MHFLTLESQVPFLPIYLSERMPELFAVVDIVDYEWAKQWKWQYKTSKKRPGKPVKYYASRKLNMAGGRSATVWLHKEICKRANGRPPSPAHIIGDHLDGQSLNCRRLNLDWATPSENRQNYNGLFAYQLRMAFMTGRWNRTLLRGMTCPTITVPQGPTLPEPTN